MTTILLVFAILILLIVVHELGHFIAAKIFRVRVDEFGVGYPPRAFRFGKIGDTEYTLNWIPFGGFVRLYGEDEEDGLHGRGSFIDAPRWKQGIILVAGVTANVIIAWLLFAGALAIGIPRIVDTPAPGEVTHLIVSDVVIGSPADAAGIKSGDEITAVSDLTGGAVADPVTPNTMTAFVRLHAGEGIVIDYERAKISHEVTVHPAQGVLKGDAGQPAIGVALALLSSQSLSWKQALGEALWSTRDALIAVSEGLWGIIDTALHGSPDLAGVVGPVGLVGVVGDAAQSGFGQVLALAGFIAVNLAIVNLIPIPALDGGRLVILIVESIFRRSAPRLLMQLVNTLGIALIIILMLTVTYHDILRLLV